MLGSVVTKIRSITHRFRGHLQRHRSGCDESDERKKHEAQEAREPVCAEAVREVHREDGKPGQDGLLSDILHIVYVAEASGKT